MMNTQHNTSRDSEWVARTIKWSQESMDSMTEHIALLMEEDAEDDLVIVVIITLLFVAYLPESGIDVDVQNYDL